MEPNEEDFTLLTSTLNNETEQDLQKTFLKEVLSQNVELKSALELQELEISKLRQSLLDVSNQAVLNTPAPQRFQQLQPQFTQQSQPQFTHQSQQPQFTQQSQPQFTQQSQPQQSQQQFIPQQQPQFTQQQQPQFQQPQFTHQSQPQFQQQFIPQQTQFQQQTSNLVSTLREGVDLLQKSRDESRLIQQLAERGREQRNRLLRNPNEQTPQRNMSTSTATTPLNQSTMSIHNSQYAEGLSDLRSQARTLGNVNQQLSQIASESDAISNASHQLYSQALLDEASQPFIPYVSPLNSTYQLDNYWPNAVKLLNDHVTLLRGLLLQQLNTTISIRERISKNSEEARREFEIGRYQASGFDKNANAASIRQIQSILSETDSMARTFDTTIAALSNERNNLVRQRSELENQAKSLQQNLPLVFQQQTQQPQSQQTQPFKQTTTTATIPSIPISRSTTNSTTNSNTRSAASTSQSQINPGKQEIIQTPSNSTTTATTTTTAPTTKESASVSFATPERSYAKKKTSTPGQSALKSSSRSTTSTSQEDDLQNLLKLAKERTMIDKESDQLDQERKKLRHQLDQISSIKS